MNQHKKNCQMSSTGWAASVPPECTCDAEVVSGSTPNQQKNRCPKRENQECSEDLYGYCYYCRRIMLIDESAQEKEENGGCSQCGNGFNESGICPNCDVESQGMKWRPKFDKFMTYMWQSRSDGGGKLKDFRWKDFDNELSIFIHSLILNTRKQAYEEGYKDAEDKVCCSFGDECAHNNESL